MKLFLFLSLSFSLLTCSENVRHASITFSNDFPLITVDNQPIRCHCGKASIEITVLNGIVSAHCADHRDNNSGKCK